MAEEAEVPAVAPAEPEYKLTTVGGEGGPATSADVDSQAKVVLLVDGTKYVVDRSAAQRIPIVKVTIVVHHTFDQLID